MKKQYKMEEKDNIEKSTKIFYPMQKFAKIHKSK